MGQDAEEARDLRRLLQEKTDECEKVEAELKHALHSLDRAHEKLREVLEHEARRRAELEAQLQHLVDCAAKVKLFSPPPPIFLAADPADTRALGRLKAILDEYSRSGGDLVPIAEVRMWVFAEELPMAYVPCPACHRHPLQHEADCPRVIRG